MKVKMINSAGEYVAGEEYDLDTETATRFLGLGYCSWVDEERSFTEEELAALRQSVQVVNV